LELGAAAMTALVYLMDAKGFNWNKESKN
jgi:hypothetical protein